METLLWTYKDIAEQYRYSQRYIRDTIMKDPEAPKPVFPGRYKPADVKRFLNVVQARPSKGCNRPSHDEDRASQTSGKDQEH
jgi:hypothetical protein